MNKIVLIGLIVLLGYMLVPYVFGEQYKPIHRPPTLHEKLDALKLDSFRTATVALEQAFTAGFIEGELSCLDQEVKR